MERVDPVPRTTTRRGATAAMVAAVLVLLGSCSYRTRWESTRVVRNGRVRPKSSATDGIGQWAYFTFPLGLLAVALLAAARALPASYRLPRGWGRRIGGALAILAAACLAAASAYASNYWRPLLIERETNPALVYIAWGLPIVAAAGTLGTLACLAFAISLLRRQAGDS